MEYSYSKLAIDTCLKSEIVSHNLHWTFAERKV